MIDYGRLDLAHFPLRSHSHDHIPCEIERMLCC